MYHNFHIVSQSVYPILTSVVALAIVTSTVMSLNYGVHLPVVVSTVGVVVLLFLWFKDVVNEGTIGYHSAYVVDGLNQGIVLFIFSEIMFFFAFFWSFFDSALSPSVELGMVWGPIGVVPLHPYHVPLLNTVILLTSGITGTWAHHNIVSNNKASSQITLTVVLGVLFTVIQVYEYSVASFTLTDGVFGSVFYVSTGSHGLHVVIGTIFLLVCTVRIVSFQLNSYHHVGLELALWYWHFVDVVWLFLYVFVYWWSY